MAVELDGEGVAAGRISEELCRIIVHRSAGVFSGLGQCERRVDDAERLKLMPRGALEIRHGVLGGPLEANLSADPWKLSAEGRRLRP